MSVDVVVLRRLHSLLAFPSCDPQWDEEADKDALDVLPRGAEATAAEELLAGSAFAGANIEDVIQGLRVRSRSVALVSASL